MKSIYAYQAHKEERGGGERENNGTSNTNRHTAWEETSQTQHGSIIPIATSIRIIKKQLEQNNT